MTEYKLGDGYFHRDGSSCKIDILDDKIDNANLMLVGPTGSGKTVNLMEKLMDYEEKHDAKIVIFDCCGAYNNLHLLLESYEKKSEFYEFDEGFVKSVLKDSAYNNDDEGCAFLKDMNCLPDILSINFKPFLKMGEEHAMSKVLLALLEHISHIVSSDNGGRDTIIVMDEVHNYLRAIGLSNAMQEFSDRIAHLNAKNTWVWMATQNVDEIPQESTSLLNKFEYWEILAMHPHEFEGLSRLKNITSKQKSQILSMEKKQHCYVEGIFLNRTNTESNQVFRFCASSLALILCANEAHERRQRLAVMENNGLSEIEAIKHMERKLHESRWGPLKY